MRLSSSSVRTRSRGVSSIALLDRKSTRLNSSHSQISYAVFCLKKKKKQTNSLNFSINTQPIHLPTIYNHQECIYICQISYSNMILTLRQHHLHHLNHMLELSV